MIALLTYFFFFGNPRACADQPKRARKPRNKLHKRVSFGGGGRGDFMTIQMAK